MSFAQELARRSAAHAAGNTAAGGPMARSLAAPSAHPCGTSGTAPRITKSAGFAAMMRATNSGSSGSCTTQYVNSVRRSVQQAIVVEKVPLASPAEQLPKLELREL